jgi:hypothetical protein
MKKPELPLDIPVVPDAQLIVCAAAAATGKDHTLSDALQRLRDWCRLPGQSHAHAKKPVLHLHVDDLNGQRVATIADAGPELVLDLPAGTYQVTAILGDICRGYTLTLQPGASFNLQLCHALRS